MEVKQIYELMNTVTHEILGDETIVNEDLSNIVDIGTEIFNASAVDAYVKSLVNHGSLVERSCDKNVNIAFLDVLNRSFKRSHGCLGRLRSRLAWLHEHIFRETVDDVYPLLMDILRRIDDICIYLVDVVDLLLVEAEDL